MISDEQFSSSSYNVLTPLNHPGRMWNNNNNDTTMNDSEQQKMIERIMSIVNDRLDDAQECTSTFHQSGMQPIFFHVLSEIKQKTGVNMRQISMTDDSYDKELIRLDTMLRAERILDHCPSTPSSETDLNALDHPEYQANLDRIRHFYHNEQAKFDKSCNDFCSHVITLLHQQSQLRPITSEEIARMVSIVRKKLSPIQLQLKQNTCEAVMCLRTRFLDARRKRRNFDKVTQKIFNEYFYSHLSNPYPSEEAKEELARKCGVTIAQVNNWFGNKRGRYKKSMRNTQTMANNT